MIATHSATTPQRYLMVLFLPLSDVQNGGGRANMGLWRQICGALGTEQVDTFVVNPEGHVALPSRIARTLMLPLNYFNGLTPPMVGRIVERALTYDGVFLSSSLMGIVASALKRSGYKGRIVTQFHNIETDYYRALMSHWRPDRAVKVNAAEVNERLAIEYSDCILSFNERDNELLAKRYGRGADLLIPIVLPDLLPTSISSDNAIELTRQPLHCLFVGSYFTANVEGLLWFVSQVLPHVNAELTVVGLGMEKLKERLEATPGVHVVGAATDLVPYWLEADVVVSPIFSGSGMKVKTCEALMFGRNIIGTREAFEGYQLDTAKVGAQAETAEAFIAAIQQMSAHPVPRYNAYSRQVYLEKHAPESLKEKFKQLLMV